MNPGNRNSGRRTSGNRKPEDGRPHGRQRSPADSAYGARRRVAFRFGLSAEGRAAALLVVKGYRILARRFRTPLGEIDIIARRRDMLAFVEVKARDNFDEAAEASAGASRTASSARRRYGSPPIRKTPCATCDSTPSWSSRGVCRVTCRRPSMRRCKARREWPGSGRRPGGARARRHPRLDPALLQAKKLIGRQIDAQAGPGLTLKPPECAHGRSQAP
jgi:hypothetical protein